MNKNIPLILLFALGASLSPSSGNAGARNCALVRLATIDLEESANGHLLVPVTIDGTNALMLLNTGTVASTLLDTEVSRLKLETRSSSSILHSATGQPHNIQVVIVKALAIGSAKFKNHTEFLEYPASFLPDTVKQDFMDRRVVGVIGMDILANMDMELDVAHHKMKIYSQVHCPDKVVYWSKDFDSISIRLGPHGEFFFPIGLDGKKIEATLNTFAPTTTLTTDVTKKLYNFDSHSPDVELEVDALGKTIGHYRAMQLDAVGFKVVNAQITLIEPSPICHLSNQYGAAAYDNCEGSAPLKLGLNILKKLHLYIATKEKVLYLTPADASDQL